MGVIGEAPSPAEAVGRYLVVHLPAFRLERCGYAAEEIAALVAEVKSAVRLVAVTPAARDADLWVGMTATEARARCPEIALEPWDEAGESTDRAALASAFGRLTDRVLLLSAEDLALEIAATAHLFGGEEGICAAAAELAERLGHAARLAVADDPVAARALAVGGQDRAVTIVPPGQGAAALAPLPVWTLFPERDLARALDALGIDTVGQFAALDPASVSGRFGEPGLRLHRVARGEVASRRPATWAADTSPVIAEVVLGGPTVTLAPIHFVLPGLLRRVVAALSARDEAVVRLVVRLVLDTGASRRVAVSVGRPTRSVETLERVVRTRLENLRIDAPVVELAVEVEESTADPGWQPGLVDRTEAQEPLPELIARLTDALGAEALFAAEAVPTWCPERAWRPAPFRPHVPASPPPRPARIDPVDAVVRYEADLPRPRPTRLLERAEPVQVREERGRPVAVHGRRGWEPVTRCEGPEHLTSGWWNPLEHFARTYWVVGTRSGVQWLFHDGRRWYRHGWFD